MAPSGDVVAVAATTGDEVVTARIDLDVARSYRAGVRNLARNRRPEHYGPVTGKGGNTYEIVSGSKLVDQTTLVGE